MGRAWMRACGRQRVQDEANRKRSQAAKEQPRPQDGSRLAGRALNDAPPDQAREKRRENSRRVREVAARAARDQPGILTEGQLPEGPIRRATMVHRMLALFAVALALTVGAWGCRSTATTHEGRVVSVGTGTLTMTDMAGTNQHTYTVA